MYILRLFDRADPGQPLDARLIEGGSIRIGRDPAADWVIADPDREISRIHCLLALEDGQLSLTDLSANGVFLDDDSRIARDTPVPVAARSGFRIGKRIVRIDEAEALAAAAPKLVAVPPVPSSGPRTDGALLDAFCAGAHLDSSLFANEDPAQIMERIGAVYRQTVLGLGTLMSERTAARSDLQMERTTIGAVGNNPFKWAPTQKVAADLIGLGADGFLAGAKAVEASFEDLKTHLLCLAAGSRGAVAAVLGAVDPSAIEAAVTTKGFSLKGKGATCWADYRAAHARLASDADDTAERGFRRAYEARLSGLGDADKPA